MYKLFEFIRSIYVVVLFIILEGIAIHYYANSTPYTQAKLLLRSNQAVGALHSGFSSVTNFLTLGRENRTLLQRVMELEEQNAVLRGAKTDSLLDYYTSDDADKPYRMLAARVVSNSINNNKNFIILNRGTQDGAEKDMAVLSPDGSMVGFVVECSRRYSVVMSVLNTSFKASGKIADSEYFGSIYWDASDRYHVRMEELSKYAEIKEGAEIVTTGFSLFFPEGITIGWVDDFEINETNTAYNVSIHLAVDMSHLSDVVLVKNNDIEELQNLEAAAQQLYNVK